MKRLWSLLLILPLLVSSCRKEERNVSSNDVLLVVDHAVAERCIVPIWSLVNSRFPGIANSVGQAGDGCLFLDSISGDTAQFPSGGPVVFHLRSADTPCTPYDGAERVGSIQVIYDSLENGTVLYGRYRIPDMQVDDYRVRCFARWKRNMTSNTTEMTVDTTSIFYEGAWSRRFRGELTYALVDGEGDEDAANDLYHVTFHGTGGDRTGDSFGCHTTTVLELALSCKWLLSGKEDFDHSDGLERDIDHGATNCDASATIRAGETIFGLTIP